MSYHQMYRRTTLGNTLQEALDEMVRLGLMDRRYIDKIFQMFDKCISDALSKKVKTRLNFKGKLNAYRCCDNVWTFVMNDVEIKEPSFAFSVDKMKVVACECKSNKASSGSKAISNPVASSSVAVNPLPEDDHLSDDE